jgi:chromosome segregation ATPase
MMWRGWCHGRGEESAILAPAANTIHNPEVSVTKAQEVYEKVEELVAGGTERPEAFRQIAEELGIQFNSVRGAYYTHTRTLNGGASRTRRRETSPEDAVASARAVLERALEDIDQEVSQAQERATESKAEADALKASAPDRKKEIQARLKALE